MKKYMIGFFSVLFLITGCLIAGYQVSYNNLLEKEKAIELTKNEKNDSIQTRRSSAKGESVSDDAYYLKALRTKALIKKEFDQAFEKYDVIVINFANPDMVGHTGVQEAAIKAVETVDECVGKAVEALKEVDGQMFICADHGNAEQLIDYETGAPWTAHTTNPVPFILVNADPKYTLRENGCLADIVPTLIQLMGMEQPAEMTGKSLLVEK